MKTCSRCEQSKPLTAYRKWVTRCRECEAEVRRSHRADWQGHPRDLVKVPVAGWGFRG